MTSGIRQKPFFSRVEIPKFKPEVVFHFDNVLIKLGVVFDFEFKLKLTKEKEKVDLN